MDFLKLIQSLDELLYEIVSWLLFYPLTLWRMIRAPLQTMLQAERELTEDERFQFDDLLAPPLFLLLTLIITHAAELSLVGQSELVESNVGLKGMISNDINLVLFRVVTFAVLPLAAARRLIKARGGRVEKQILKPPFYAQCYLAGALALAGSVATFLGESRLGGSQELYGWALLAALAWVVIVETRWFATQLNTTVLRGLGQALLMIGQWLLVLVIAALALS